MFQDQHVFVSVTLDLMFVIDGSGSIQSWNFDKIRTWLKDFIALLDLGPDKIQIGIVS